MASHDRHRQSEHRESSFVAPDLGLRCEGDGGPSSPSRPPEWSTLSPSGLANSRHERWILAKRSSTAEFESSAAPCPRAARTAPRPGAVTVPQSGPDLNPHGPDLLIRPFFNSDEYLPTAISADEVLITMVSEGGVHQKPICPYRRVPCGITACLMAFVAGHPEIECGAMLVLKPPPWRLLPLARRQSLGDVP